MKKLFAFLLCVVLVLSFTACGSKNESDSDQVTLKMMLGSYEQNDHQKVEDKINERLKTLFPNTKLDIMYDISMGSRWSLYMAGEEVIDIADSGYHTSLATEIAADSYLPLNDLINDYAPNIKAEMTGKYEYPYSTGMVGGELYAIPIIQYHIKETTLLNMPEKLVKYIDLKGLVNTLWGNVKTTEEFYKIVTAYFEKATASGDIDGNKISKYCDIDRLFKVAKRGYSFVGGTNNGTNICYDMYAKDVKLIDFYTTEEYKTFIKYAALWYEKGYIAPEALTGQTYSGLPLMQFVEGSRAMMGKDGTYVGENTSDADKNVRYIVTNKAENDILSDSVLGSMATYISIPFTCQHPQRAIKFLDFLHSDKGSEILNLIAYGLEGEHYEVVANEPGKGVIKFKDYQAQPDSTSKYGVCNWMVGDLFNMYIPEIYTEAYAYGKKYYDEELAKIKHGALFGFQFDVSGFNNQLSNMNAVSTQYNKQLICGVNKNYTETYNTLLSKLNDAKMASVIEGLQKQADNFLK